MSSGYEPRSELRLPLNEAEAQLEAQIEAGRELLDSEIMRLAAPEPETEAEPGVIGGLMLRGLSRGLARLTGPYPDIEALKRRIDEWLSYNRTWISVNIGGEVAELYKSAPAVEAPKNALRFQTLIFLRESVQTEISRLESIRDRLHLLTPETMASAIPSSVAQPTPNGPIFIVHGRDTLRAERVARVVGKATGRETIILREQANLGRTLIEKFEEHATGASYAIVVLTPDDEGGIKGQDKHNPRARQNVIFEMGYFYGTLGRRRVSVLLYADVEKPSDMDGIAYIDFDDHGAWEIKLFRELAGADIRVDISDVG